MHISTSLINSSEPVIKSLVNGGTHRMVEPVETLERVRPILPRMGITRIANITGLDRIGIPVVQAVRPNSRSLSVSQGKGLNLVAAKASAVMESVEAYHADHITLPVKHARYSDLSHDHLLVDTTTLNRRKDSPYNVDTPILWVQGLDLLQDEQIWIPLETVDTDYTLPRPSGSGMFACTSNGLASGNHLLEAVAHGICEVVERDATTLWALSGADAQENTRIDLETINDEACRHLLRLYALAGIDVGVWETTSDFGIPSFLCKIRDASARPPGNVSLPGYGCHPLRAIALFRALTEAAQTRLTIIAGSRDDLNRSRYEQLGDLLVIRQSKDWYQNDATKQSFNSEINFFSETINGDVQWLLDRLRAGGLERLIAVDLSKPEFDLPVVRIVIPGLEMALIDPEHHELGVRARRLLRARQ